MGRRFPVVGQAGRMCMELRLSVRFKVSSVLVEPWAFGQINLKLPAQIPLLWRDMKRPAQRLTHSECSAEQLLWCVSPPATPREGRFGAGEG